jgi:signal transduction histidine kinase
MADAEKANILVVDDLPEKVLVLETVLAELGQNVIAAASGEEALRKVLEHDFAVILLDVNMPTMNGLETAALIRKRKKSAHVPIIFVTAFADEMRTAEGYSLGAVDYILAPIVPEILRTKVKVFVDLFQMREQVRRQAEERIALVREQAARAAAEDAVRRSSFLAEASARLSSSLDFEATARNLARVVVPFMADLGAVTLVDEDNSVRMTELAWKFDPPDPKAAEHTGDDEQEEEVEYELGTRNSECGAFGVPHSELRTPGSLEMGTLHEDFPAPLAAATRDAIREGKSKFLNDFGPEGAPVGPPLPAGFVVHAAIVLPLRARGKNLGALALALGPSGRRFTATDWAVAEDFADRAAIALDNARLYQALQEADRRKDEFLSMLAHELRNPLAPIRNALHILKSPEAIGSRAAQVRDMMDRQVTHLTRLVDDLLDVSRITRGKIRLQAETVEVPAIVERALEISRPLIDAGRHTLSISLPDDSLCIHGDLARLAQVVANLLNNAAKYTPPAGKIWLSATREEGTAVLRVKDTGIGIPSEMLGRVFEPFTQVDRSLDRSEGGLGIGLTLVRRLVEMHGGQVQAQSAGPNQGSEFVVRLPLIPAVRSQGSGVRKVGSGSSSAPDSSPPTPARKVLVVDDNRDAANSIATLLRLEGHEVYTAHDGPAALQIAGAVSPQVVVLDIGLPELDGYEVARRLRGMAAGPETLLIALTGYGQDTDRERSRQAGFNHHLIKPVEPQTLLALLGSFVSGEQRAES